LSTDSQISVPPPTSSPAVSSLRGSTFPVIIPVIGIMKNEPMPRGAIAIPACSGG
jgi:hypothetical protein